MKLVTITILSFINWMLTVTQQGTITMTTT